jgi:hypothetical protein
MQQQVVLTTAPVITTGHGTPQPAGPGYFGDAVWCDRVKPIRQGSAAFERTNSYQPRSARIDSRSDDVVASTADGSYPQCAMQFEHRGSLPRPYASQSVVSISSL